MIKQSLSLLFALSCFAACSGRADAPEGEGRNLRGTAPEGSAVFALDAAGRRSEAVMSGASFEVALAPGAPAHLFVDDGAAVRVLRFEADETGATQSTIPDFQGTIDLGLLAVVGAGRRSADPETYVTPEHNPLASCDSDDDGTADLDDTDDDDDGVEDGEDDDRDGSGSDDDDDDLDDDNDGAPNVCDDDDDDDGVEDGEDDDAADDHDGDGVDDDEDVDDDNDGAEDEDDDDDDDDGVDDDDEIEDEDGAEDDA